MTVQERFHYIVIVVYLRIAAEKSLPANHPWIEAVSMGVRSRSTVTVSRYPFNEIKWLVNRAFTLNQGFGAVQ